MNPRTRRQRRHARHTRHLRYDFVRGFVARFKLRADSSLDAFVRMETNELTVLFDEVLLLPPGDYMIPSGVTLEATNVNTPPLGYWT